MGTTEERSSRRPAASTRMLAVRTALTLRVVFSLPLRQTEGFLDSLLRLMGLNLKAPDHHHTLAPEPNRCGAAPDPIPRRPDRLDRRFHRAEDSGLRRMERAQAQGIKETPGLAEAAHRGGCRGVHCGGRTHSEQPGRRLHTPCSSRHNRGSHPAFHRRRSLRPQVSLRSTQRGRYRERRDCDSPSSLCAVSAGPTDGPWAQRDTALERIRQVGRREWQKESGYRQQARVENSFFRYKSVLGGGLKARHGKAQRREVAIGCHILNRMAELGRPKSCAVVS